MELKNNDQIGSARHLTMLGETIIRSVGGIDKPTLDVNCINGEATNHDTLRISDEHILRGIRIRVYSVESEIVFLFGKGGLECSNDAMRTAIAWSTHWRAPMFWAKKPVYPRFGFRILSEKPTPSFWEVTFDTMRPDDEVARVYNLPANHRYSGSEGAYLDIRLRLLGRSRSKVIGVEMAANDKPFKPLWEWRSNLPEFWHYHPLNQADLARLWRPKASGCYFNLLQFDFKNRYSFFCDRNDGSWAVGSGSYRIEGEKVILRPRLEAKIISKDGRACFAGELKPHPFHPESPNRCIKQENEEIVFDDYTLRKADLSCVGSEFCFEEEDQDERDRGQFIRDMIQLVGGLNISD